MQNIPMTPSTPSTPISNDWINVDLMDSTPLDRITRYRTSPLPTAHRTQSFKNKSGRTFPKNQSLVVKDHSRSISDPDVVHAMAHKQTCSIGSGEIDEVDPSSDFLTNSVDQGGDSSFASKKKAVNRFPSSASSSDISVEKPDVKKLIEGLGGATHALMRSVDNGIDYVTGGNASAGASGGGGKWRLGVRNKNKVNKQQKDLPNSKKCTSNHKAVKVSHSSEEVLEQPSSSAAVLGEKELLRSSSSSPQETHSPVPKKKNGTGIFKKHKKKNSGSITVQTTSSQHDDAFARENSSPPPTPSHTTLQPQRRERTRTSSSRSSPLPSTGDDASPSHQQKHVVSPPITAISVASGGKEQTEVQFDLETLILPLNKDWVKCGYLWLRMKLPNGRYAWTHIVSYI